MPLLLVAFMMGAAGALQAPTLSLFLSAGRWGRSRFGSACFIPRTPSPIPVSLGLAKRSDSRMATAKLILFVAPWLWATRCCLPFNRHSLPDADHLVACCWLHWRTPAMPQLFALAREYADNLGAGSVMFSR